MIYSTLIGVYCFALWSRINAIKSSWINDDPYHGTWHAKKIFSIKLYIFNKIDELCRWLLKYLLDWRILQVFILAPNKKSTKYNKQKTQFSLPNRLLSLFHIFSRSVVRHIPTRVDGLNLCLRKCLKSIYRIKEYSSDLIDKLYQNS